MKEETTLDYKMIPGGLSPKTERGYRIINNDIVGFIIKEKGDTSLGRIEEHTGLKEHNINTAADILVYLHNQGIITIDSDRVIASVARLTHIQEQENTELPDNHNKLWTEDDTVILCELANAKKNNYKIAQKLRRTESSVSQQKSDLRKGFRMIPWIKRNPSIKKFCENPVGPNPKDRNKRR